MWLKYQAKPRHAPDAALAGRWRQKQRSSPHPTSSQEQVGASSAMPKRKLWATEQSHKPKCWREKPPLTSLALWLYTSSHCPRHGVSPGILALWWRLDSCYDNLTLHMQIPKLWLWLWVTPIAFTLPIARAGFSCQPRMLPHEPQSTEQLSARSFRLTWTLEILLSVLASFAPLSFTHTCRLLSRAEGKD